LDSIDIDQLPPASRRLLVSTLPAISDARLELYQWRYDSDLAQRIAKERKKRRCLSSAAQPAMLATSVVFCPAPALTLLSGPSLAERLAAFFAAFARTLGRKT
jgi:hypothetical protein